MTKKRKDETSYKDTAFGIIPRSKLIPLEIKGIKRAWDFVLKQVNKSKIPITPTFLKKVHKIGFGWIFPEIGGKFRNIEVIVSNYKPPRPYLIPQMMVNFTKDIKIRLKHLPSFGDSNYLNELIDLLAWMHHKFLWIHPFTDYNGRIGRLLTNMTLLNLGIPTITLKIETKIGRKKYAKALQEADKGHYGSLKKLIHSAFEEAAKELL